MRIRVHQQASYRLTIGHREDIGGVLMEHREGVEGTIGYRADNDDDNGVPLEGVIPP